jgi:hypothetical protein
MGAPAPGAPVLPRPLNNVQVLNNYMYPARACAARGKAIGLFVCLSVCRQHKNRQISRSRRLSDS